MNRPPVLDVCIVVEGCYPFVAGGVSSWLDWLIRNQPDTTFGVVALTADDRPRALKYELPENVAHFQVVSLSPQLQRPGLSQPLIDAAAFADLLHGVAREGELDSFDALAAMTVQPVRRSWLGLLARPSPPGISDLMCSEAAWRRWSRATRGSPRTPLSPTSSGPGKTLVGGCCRC